MIAPIILTFLGGICIGWYIRSVLIKQERNAYSDLISAFQYNVTSLENVMNRLTSRNEHDVFCKVLIKVSGEIIMKSKSIEGAYPGLRLTYSLLVGYKSRLSIGMREIAEKFIKILEEWLHVDEIIV